MPLAEPRRSRGVALASTVRGPASASSWTQGRFERVVLGLGLWLCTALPATAQPAHEPAISAEAIATRLADSQALLRLHNAPAAATLLTELLAQAGESLPGAHRSEVLYWLGQAQKAQGELRSAERSFMALIDQPGGLASPQFYGRALIQLLDLAVELDSHERTPEWIDRLQRMPASERPSDGAYAIGRYLFARQRYREARAALQSLASDRPESMRARYFIAAAHVAEGNLSEAEAGFSALVALPLPAPDDDRRVIELSHMALGRIFLSRGEAEKARQSYLRISQKSDLFREALYEAAWGSIRSRDYPQAEESLELLLLAYRDAHEHSYAAMEAKMLLGNLLLRRGELSRALEWFNQARVDASPVVDALRTKLTQSPQDAFRLPSDARTFSLDLLAPKAAHSLLRADRDVMRFVGLQRDLAALQRSVDEVQATIAALDRRLSDVARLGTDPVNADALRVALHQERESLRLQTRTLDQARSDAAQLGSALLPAALESTHKKFADVLLRAEAGVLDVAWARKVQHSERMAELSRDHKRELRILDDEFSPPFAAERPSAAPALPESTDSEVAEDLRRYLATGEQLRKAVFELGQENYKRHRAATSRDYQTRLAKEEEGERSERQQAIAQFEEFIKQHPNHARYTPNALFRLAELYFERSSEEFAAQVKGQTPDGATADLGSGVPNYDPSIGLYQRLLRDYPSYRLRDGVHYLLGYCQGEMGRDAEARQALLGLVCANKHKPLDAPSPWPGRKGKAEQYQDCQALPGDSRFFAESWTRIGELHFDRGELEPAVAAYSQVLPFRDSPYYDKALYKLAWTYYRQDRFADAVRRFDELVVFADQRDRAERAAGGGEPSAASGKGEKGSSLRSEAIQYLALSFAERDWDGDGRSDAEAGVARLGRFYAGRESEPHVREVLIRLGDLWFDRTEYGRAAEAYQQAIARSPLSPDSPKLQQRVALSYDRQRSFEQALRAREALARDYAPGSPWYEANRDNAQALEAATELADASLLNAITNRHASAQELRQRALASRDAKLLAQARAEYRQAAQSYATFLKQHPGAKNAYEYSYLLAESHYYGGEYAEAAAGYARVREADAKGSHLEDAAYGAIKAQEHLALLALRAGSGKAGAATGDDTGEDDVSRALLAVLPPLPVVGKTAQGSGPLAIPDEITALQAAYDRYVTLLPSSDKNSLLAYKSAELDFRYLRFDRARSRFSDVLDRYCQSERAVDAGNAILVSHTIDGNLDQVEAWTSRLQNKGCGGQGALAQQQRDSLRKLSEDVSFKKAEQLLETKRYEAAATMFIALVDKNPKAQNSDKALYNAAVAYENIGRATAAASAYERLARDYPQSSLAEAAVFRAAVNHQRVLAFDKALVGYRAIATLPRYAKSPHRRDALYNAALIADRDGDLALGIQLWRQYEADAATSPDEARDIAYRIAQLVERQSPSISPAGAQRASEEWDRLLRKYGNATAVDEKGLARMVEAHFRIGRARDTVRNPMDAQQSYASAIKLGSRLPPGSDGAEPVAHAAFLLAERRLAELERLRIAGAGAELEQSVKRFNDGVTALVSEYEKVLAYRRATWTLAAYYRMGYVFELYAKTLLSAPCPPEVKRLGEGACGMYRTKIEENVAQIEEQAVARYTVTIEQAGKLGVANAWTREARSRLSAYRPDRFPALHDEHVAQGLSPGGVAAQAQAGTGSQAQTLAEARSAMESAQYETAQILARQVLAENERSVPALLLLARINFLLGKLELCGAILGMVQQIDEGSGEAQLLLGLLALARGRDNPDGGRIAATAAFRRATELDGSLGLAWHNLSAQYLLAKNFEQALPAAQRAASLLPAASGVQLNLGSALRGVGRPAEALDIYRRLAERDPQYADAYFNLGVLMLDAPNIGGFDTLGQKRAALQYLMRYQDMQQGRRDEQLDAYVKEARAAVDREERRLQRKSTGGKP